MKVFFNTTLPRDYLISPLRVKVDYLSRKWDTTTGAEDSEGSIEVIELIVMYLLLAP
tara:strand:- start:398 stop:568 length:171 start_codon:yes stop_codon:yes gene_type:complete